MARPNHNAIYNLLLSIVKSREAGQPLIIYNRLTSILSRPYIHGSFFTVLEALLAGVGSINPRR